MNRNIVVSLLAAGIAAAVGGAFAVSRASAEDTAATTTQTYTPNRFALLAGKVDVNSMVSGQPYTMNTIVLLDGQTGHVWMLQATVSQNNVPVLSQATFVPAQISNQALLPPPGPNAEFNGDIQPNAEGVDMPMNQTGPNGPYQGDITTNPDGSVPANAVGVTAPMGEAAAGGGISTNAVGVTAPMGEAAEMGEM